MPPITGCDASFGPWGTTPGLTARLKELHAAPQNHSNTEIARMLSREFDIAISRNAVIGKCARLDLPHRLGAHKGGGSRSGRVLPKPRLTAIPAPPPPAPIIPRKPSCLRLVDLRDSGCKFPFGDGPFTFCGAPCLEEQSYCAEHYALTHSEPMKRWA